MNTQPVSPSRQDAFLATDGKGIPPELRPIDPNLEEERDEESDFQGNEESSWFDDDEYYTHETPVDDEYAEWEDEQEPEEADEEMKEAESEAFPSMENLDLDNISKFYKLVKKSTHASKKLRTTVCDYEVTFRGLESLHGEQLLQTFEPVFIAVVAELTNGLSPHDYFRLTLANDSLNNPIAMPYSKVSNYSTEYMFEQIVNTLQSYTDFRLDNTTKLCVISTQIPAAGSARVSRYQSRRTASLPEWIKQKKSLVNSTGNDNFCGFKAIAIGLGLVDRIDPKKVRTATWQNERAQEISIVAGVPLGPLSISDIKNIQPHLDQYQINVYELGSNSLYPLFTGPFKLKQINLLLHERHYFTIRSMKGLIDRNYFCIHCKKGYTKKDHICRQNLNRCFLCHDSRCQNRDPNGDTLMSCDRCGKKFKSFACATAHDRQTCDKFRYCPTCDTFVKTDTLSPPSLHDCGLRWCTLCKKKRPVYTDHPHFIPKYYCDPDLPPDERIFPIEDDVRIETFCLGEGQKIHSSKPKEVVYFLDFESHPDIANHHIVAISCVLQHEDGAPTYFFYGKNTVNQFLDKILSLDMTEIRYTMVSHFGSGFDHYCFLNALFERKLCPNVVAKGTRFISISLLGDRMRFIDSWMFLQMGLRKMPSSFGIPEIQKGWFPYSLIRPELLEQTIPFPSREMFEPELMTPDERKDFEEWYPTAVLEFHHKPYNVLDQLYRYNLSDVEVLRQSVQKFRSDYTRLHGIDPILRACTMVSANFLVWRRNYIKEDSICIVPDSGFPRVRSSRMCAVWLTYVAEKEGIHIEGAHNGLEKRFGPYHVDGYSEESPRKLYQVSKPDNHTVWFFMGCLWHGCPICFPKRDVVVDGRSMIDRYNETRKTVRYFAEKLNVNIVIEWEHGFQNRLRLSTSLKALNKRFGNANPWIKIRNAYMGGRVECFCSLYKCTKGEKIFLFDFCSLYPYIMYRKKFWTGVPRIIRYHDLEAYGNIRRYGGMIYARVIPPQGLFIPILPCKIGDKLLFTLCGKCAETQNESCDCSAEDRAIDGIWTSQELFLALDHGYKLITVYEIWSYETSDCEIFQGFVRLCLKHKAEASGWPKGIDEAGKRAYVENYKKLYDITLDPEQISYRPSMRLLNKLAVNALSGRLGMKTKRNELKYVNSFEGLRNLIENPNLTVNDIAVINEELALVQCQKQTEMNENHLLNIVVIAQITSYGRIELFNALKTAHCSGARILYSDTDSVYVAFPENATIPFPTGSVLGMLQNETIEEYGPGSHVDQFWCTGAKSYAYRVIKDGTSKVVYKLKGFRINSEVLDILTPPVLEQLIKNECPITPKITYKHQIIRDAKAAFMKERNVTKTFRFLNDKRFIDRQTWITYPWGY